MKIDFDKLDRLTAEESKAEYKIAEDFRENSDLYKASFRIAMKVKRTLRMRGMTQAQLSDIMGVDRAVVCRFMSGKANLCRARRWLPPHTHARCHSASRSQLSIMNYALCIALIVSCQNIT